MKQFSFWAIFLGFFVVLSSVLMGTIFMPLGLILLIAGILRSFLKTKGVWGPITSILVAIVFIALIQTCFLKWYKVTQQGMEPTLKRGDLILGLKMKGDFKKDDIIIYRPQSGPPQYCVHRIVAIPNEELGTNGMLLTVGGKLLDNAYHLPKTYDISANNGTRSPKIPAGYYCVGGDNALLTRGKLMWGFVPKDKIEAKVIFTIRPKFQNSKLSGDKSQIT